MAPILLGRVGDEPLDVVGKVSDDGTPDEDEATVGHEHAPDEDEDEHDGDAHEQWEIGAEIIGVDGIIKFQTTSAEILEVLDLALLGLGGTTFAI